MKESAKNIAVVTVIISIFNFFGKFLGLIRSIILAALFGIGYQYDALLIAFVLPSILPSLIKNLITTAFIPQFMKNINSVHVDINSWNGANTLFTIAFIIAILFTIVMYSNIESVVEIIAPGVPENTKDLAIVLSKIMMLTTVVLVLIAILSSIAYCFDKFKAASLEPITINVILITILLVYRENLDMRIVAWGLFAGYIVQFIIQAINIKSEIRSFIRPRLNISHPDFVEPLKHMLPHTIGLVSAWVMGIIDKRFASYLDQGSISALSYGEIVAYLPIEVIAASIMITFYPKVSREYISNDLDALKLSYINGVRSLIMVMLPFMAIFMFYSTDIIALLFKRGEFDDSSLILTTGVLFYLSISLIPRAISYFNYRILHATKHPWLQVIVGILGVITNISLNSILIEPMGVNGIALATSLSFLQSWLLSSYILKSIFGFSLIKDMIKAIIEASIMSLFIISISYLIFITSSTFSFDNELLNRFVSLSGLPVAIVLLVVVGNNYRQNECVFIYNLVMRKALRKRNE